MIFSIWNIWILQKQPRYKDITIMLPRWYLLGYRPNSAQISNITSVWNKREFDMTWKHVFCDVAYTICVPKPTSLFIFNDLNWVSSSRAYIITSTKTLLFYLSYDNKVFSISHSCEDQMITPLLVVVLGLHLSNQVARHHVGLVVLPLMVPV